ncbi:MAG: DUF2339 domain-containing protein [Chitinophagaceae bacterium]|nr:DUF2339 domain-containing protein [Chitinophagaceae bacterium]
MELLIAILFIVILILIIKQKNSYAAESQLLRKEMAALREQLSKLMLPEKTDKQTPVPEKKEMPKSVPPPAYEKPLEETLFVIPEKPAPVVDISEEITSTPVIKKETPPVKAANIATPPPPRPPKPGFFERNPDLEKFIGENLVSKIGIAILVLAIGFFVKYAIDNNWIGSVGRVAIGILCGGILVALAHKLRKNYQAFSSVLVGGGLAVFYFTITLAYHEYQLFSQVTAFIIMLVITAFAVLLALLYNRQELAIIALVGGFATPFMASSGSGNYKSLFIYLIILNSGLLIIAYRKAWRLLNLLAFIFTVILFAMWLLTLPFESEKSVYINGFIFATVFYLLFLAINIAHNIRENKKFIASDFGILLANTCLYFSAGLYMIVQSGAADYKGLFSAAMGVFNLALSYILFRNKKIDTNVLYLLIGITLTFISLTAPLQLKGNYITLFWASEAVLLFWLFRKSRIRLMLFSSAIVWIAMLVSLVMDWINIYGDPGRIHTVLINKGFVTTLYAALGSFVLWVLMNKEKDSREGTVPGKTFVLVMATVLLFGSGAWEINHQFLSRYPGGGFNRLYLLLYALAFVIAFTVITSRAKLFGGSRIYQGALYAAGMLLYFVALGDVFNIQYNMLHDKTGSVHFAVHWTSAALFVIIAWNFISLMRSGAFPKSMDHTVLTWLICICMVLFISFEGSLISNALFYTDNNSFETIQRVYIKTGLPILWGLSSFVLMWLGMRHKYRPLRIISLVLFAITLLKLFLFDIRNIPVAGKIAAFFSLGVLLLIVSFMYQRLKKIIIEDEKKSGAQ